MGFLDYTQHKKMVARVPPLSIIPPINKRVEFGRWVASYGTALPVFFILGTLVYKWFLNSATVSFFPTKPQYKGFPDFVSGSIVMKQRIVGNLPKNY